MDIVYNGTENPVERAAARARRIAQSACKFTSSECRDGQQDGRKDGHTVVRRTGWTGGLGRAETDAGTRGEEGAGWGHGVFLQMATKLSSGKVVRDEMSEVGGPGCRDEASSSRLPIVSRPHSPRLSRSCLRPSRPEHVNPT